MVARERRKHPFHIRNPRIDLYARKMERTSRIFNDLKEQSNSGIPIIVEGRKDDLALRRLGIKGKVYCLKATGESRFTLLERLDGASRAIILTDFDREGGELEAWLYQELSHRGIHPDNRAWWKLRGLARTEVRSVEELPTFVRTLQLRSLGLRS